MPTPLATENEAQFMERCIPVLINEGEEQDQAVAVCQSMWDRNKKINIAATLKKQAKENNTIISK